MAFFMARSTDCGPGSFRDWHAGGISRNLTGFALGVLLIAGCGGPTGPKTVPVSGVVTFKGVPLTRGEVSFIPADTSKGPSAAGKIGSDGKDALTTRSVNDGAIPGDYRVVVFSYEDPPEQAKDRAAPPVGKPAIPTRYFDMKTSELKATV